MKQFEAKMKRFEAKPRGGMLEPPEGARMLEPPQGDFSGISP